MANNDFYHCNNDNDSNDDHSTMITANNDLSENRDDQRNQSHNYSSNNTAINKRLPTVTLDIHKGEPIRLQVKVMVPSDDHPNYNFVGKLLGPKGKSLKWLQERTKTKMAILGRGSKQEKELRESNDTKYSHLNENLHVEITAIATAAEAYHRIGEALFELKRFLVPVNQPN